MRIAGADVLRMAGDDVPEGPLTDRDRKRLGRLFEHLVKHGYLAAGRGEAEAGDTVELVERILRPGKTGEAVFVVRASARYVEATRRVEQNESGAYKWHLIRTLLDD